MKSYCDLAIEDPQELKLTRREEAYLEVSEMLWKAMRRAKVAPAGLAAKLGVTKGRVSQILDGRNITLSTVQDVLTALGCKLEAKAKRINP